MKTWINASLVSAALLAAGCSTAKPIMPSFGAMASPPVASSDPHVKFKDGERYVRDLSSNLNMPREDICKELGRYDCVSDAFRIVLGGVEAPNLLVNEPIENAALTSPIALDRVALHICTNRVKLDRSQPSEAVLFRTGAFGRNGKARSIDPAWMQDTANAIYSAVLLRAPSAAEVRNLTDLYKQVRDGRPANSVEAAADWVTLSCFAVASSLEAVFY